VITTIPRSLIKYFAGFREVANRYLDSFLALVSKVRKRLQTVSHYWCTIILNRLVQFSLRHLANRAVRFRRSTPRFASIVYRYLDIRQCNLEISLKFLLASC